MPIARQTASAGSNTLSRHCRAAELPCDVTATPYASVVEEGISYLSSHNSFTFLEKLCVDHKMTYLKKARTTPFGVEPLISYFLIKDFEMSALRTVLVGKANAIPYEQIKERLPGEYI